MKAIRNVAICMLMIGVIGFSLNLIFGLDTITYISEHQTNGITFYKYNFLAYVQGIRNTLSDPSELRLNLQTLTWQTTSANFTQQQFWEVLGNNMAFSLNVVITGLNIFLYPIRVGAYAVRFLLSLIGLNINDTSNSLNWLVQTIQILINLQIPYVTI